MKRLLKLGCAARLYLKCYIIINEQYSWLFDLLQVKVILTVTTLSKTVNISP